MATMTIEDYKKQYEAARAAGDAAGMQAANDGANAIRASQGVALEYANQDIANVAASSKASSSSSGTANKYYTGSQPTYSTVGESAYNASKNAGFDADTDYSTLLKQQIAAGASANDVYNTLASRIAKANSNDSLKQYAWDDNTRQAIEYLVTQQGGSLAGIDADFAAKATKDMLSAGGTAGAPSGQSLTGYVNDYSSYLEQMYAAQKAAALAGIKNAYEQNINAIDRAGEGVDEAYQTARNNAAGASELAKRNFAEYAAANGLNSGTGGQAELARNVTLQNNLNTIDTQEAQTIADLELQRANAETEYNNAIAQAEAEGNYQLAAALYQEKVRYDNAMISAIQQEYQNALSQYQLNYQAQRDAVSDSQWQQSFGFQQQQYNDSVAQSQKSSLAEYGNAFLQQGLMPSTEMLNAMGITAQDAQNYIAAVQAQKVASAGGGSSGGSGGSGSGTEDIYSKLLAAGAKDYGTAYDMLVSLGYSDSNAEVIADYFSSVYYPANGSGGGLQVDMASVLALGYGPISETRLNQLVESGEVEEYKENGVLKFRKVEKPSVNPSSLLMLGLN